MNRRSFFRRALAGMCFGLAAATLRPKTEILIQKTMQPGPAGLEAQLEQAWRWPPPSFCGIPIVEDPSLDPGKFYVINYRPRAMEVGFPNMPREAFVGMVKDLGPLVKGFPHA